MSIDTTIVIQKPVREAVPQFAAPDGLRTLDMPQVWLKYAAFEPPLTPDEINRVQADIDSIIGVTRGNESIAKLVWNGDKRYWKRFHNKWDTTGKPIGDLYQRPRLLYQTVVDDTTGVFIRDAFPPRWLILTRIEPEQYADTYASESKFYCPDRRKFVQLLPSECPPVQYVCFKIIALHEFGCCQRAARDGDRTCYGKYAHPNSALEEFRQKRKSMEEEGIWDSHPFDSPDRIARRMIEQGLNNYDEQAMNQFRTQADRAIDETPFALADAGLATKVSSEKQLKRHLKEESKRAEDVLEQRLKEGKLEG